VSPSSSIC